MPHLRFDIQVADAARVEMADGVHELAKVGREAVARQAIVGLNLIKHLAELTQLKRQIRRVLSEMR